jgi:hypothetical protein
MIAPAIGELSGGGTISPSNALDFKMTVLVHAGGVLSAVGNTSIPFTVTGTSSDPVFRPDLKAVAKEQVKSVVKGEAGKAAEGLLRGLLGGKK